VATGATGSAKPSSAGAQDYPSRPITLIVSYAAAAGNDVMGRTAAEKMSKTLGQQIVSRIGAAPAAASPPPDRQETACEIAGIPPISKGRQLKCGPPSPPKLHRLPDAYWASEPFRIVCSA
jgi:hypothetical protein